MRRYLFAVGLILLVSIVAACGAGGPQVAEPVQQPAETGAEDEQAAVQQPEAAESDAQEKVFRYNFPSDYAGERLDVSKGYTILAPNFFTGLTRLNPNNEVIPGAAESWDVSSDGLTYTFHLREMNWSDGTPLTAHDFEYSWKRACDPETKSIRCWMIYLVEGAEAFNQGEGDRDDVAVTALDDRTLEVHLTAPAAFFPAYIAANNVYYATPRHVVEEAGDDWTDIGNIVFSGPFVVSRYEPESLVVMEPNPEWPLEQPKVDRVEYYVVPEEATVLAKYQAGELDYAQGIPLGEIDLVRNDPEMSEAFAIMPESRTMTLQVNVTKAPFDDPLVRQAFLYAIDQAALTNGPFRGVFDTAFTLRPKTMPGSDDEYLNGAFDPDRARQLLAEAGYPDGEGFPEIGIAVRNREDSSLAAEYLQRELSRILNIPIQVNVMEYNAFLDMVQGGRGDIWLSAVFSLSPDLYDLYNVIQGAASGNAHWEDDHFNELLKQAAAEPDPEARMALYDEAESYIVIENAVMIPLWYTDRPALIQSYLENLGEDERSLWLHSWEYVDLAQ